MEECGDRKRVHNVAEEESVGSFRIPASSRWSPTVEQKEMLERLYRQGIRKPSADQIQQITSRLRVLGHVEAKNVFYWFHNHKAKLRLKQKQKQQDMINTTTISHRHHPTNMNTTILFCSPCYDQLLLEPDDHVKEGSNAKLCKYTTTTRRSLRLEKPLLGNNNSDRDNRIGLCCGAEGSGYERGRRTVDTCHEVNDENITTIGNNNYCNSDDNRETLVLFPLTPTGVLHGRDHQEESLSAAQPFYDFLSR